MGGTVPSGGHTIIRRATGLGGALIANNAKRVPSAGSPRHSLPTCYLCFGHGWNVRT
jgi:hypothetical protein